jgi:initiation factor 1A
MPRGVKTSRSVNKAAAGGSNRELKIRDDDQRYGIVTKLLGNNRVMVNLVEDGTLRECRCTIRGSMRRREWISTDSVVLVALRELAGDTHDIIGKYTDDEVKTLKRLGELVLPAPVEEHASINQEVEIVFEDIDEI